MCRTVPLSIIKSFSLYTQQWYVSYRFADSFRAGSGGYVLILLAIGAAFLCRILHLLHVTVSVTAIALLFSKVMKAGDLIRCLSDHHVSIQRYFQDVS